MACIYIYKGDDTNWNNNRFLTIYVAPAEGTSIDLSDMKAQFILGPFNQEYPLTEGYFRVDLAAAVTSGLEFGPINGAVRIYDTENRVKTVANNIPFFVTQEVLPEQNQSIDIEVPEGSEVNVNVAVGGAMSYDALADKPTIDGITIEGDKTASDYGLATQEEVSGKVSKSGDTMTGDLVLDGAGIKTQNAKIHEVNSKLVLGNSSNNYGFYVNPNGTGAAFVSSNGNADVLKSTDLRNSYDASSTYPITGQGVASAISTKQDTLSQAQLSAINSGITSSLVTQIGTNTTNISNKQDTLVSGTNIKTVNNNSLLGSGNISIDYLPSQTGNSGKYLTTDGTNASWAEVDSLPAQTGNSGKFLTTDGTEASWATVQGGGGASFLSGGTAPTSGTNADMPGQTYVNTTDGSLYVCQALTGGDPTTYYTVVGSPTINSYYVASNFGSNSYVDTGVTFRPSGAWNIKMKFNFGMTSSTWYKLTGHTGNGVSIGVDNQKIKLECSYTGSGWDICAFTCSTTILAGRDYWIDFGFDGTNLYYVDLSTDGVTYTRDGSATSTKKVYSSSTMGLGCAFSGYTSHYFVGSIYLTDFEIYEATELTYRAVSLGGPLWKSATESLKTITGYNASAKQVLKNVNGTLTWVNEA